MKRILFTLLLLVGLTAGYAQMTNNGGTITVESGATLVIEGNYTSASAGVLRIDGNVQLKGNFVNNSGSVDVASLGTLTFNGAAPQQIGGTAPTTFGCAVVVNNAGNGVSLTGADAVLAKALTLTNGKLTLNAFDLTMAAVGISVTSGNYVVTNNAAGELKGVVGSSNVTFPVGSATSYNPVVLNNTGGTSDTYGVVFTQAMPANWVGTDHAVTGNWAVSEAVANGSNLSVTPQWYTANQQASFDRTDCAVGITTDNGTTATWTASGAATGSNPYTRTGTGFGTVGKFMVSDYFYEGIDIDLDLFLAGAYNAGSMTTGLNSILPLADPYGNGVNATSVPSGTIVDWVEIELRDQTTPATVVKSYSAFLNNDGNVIGITGTPGLKITGVAKAQYYVAIRHRNHLGAMTANPINFSAAGPFAFDFSAGTGIYGTNAMRNMGAKWALWAGDADGNGSVQLATGSSDITPINNAVVGNPLSGGDPTWYGVAEYNNADTDLNSFVQFASGTSDITPISSSVTGNPANGTGDPTTPLSQQLPN